MWVNSIPIFILLHSDDFFFICLVSVVHKNLPCMNSNNLLTTVLRNLQCALRNLGYCPTTYIILLAIMALLSFPRFCSHSPNKSYNKNKIHIIKGKRLIKIINMITLNLQVYIIYKVNKNNNYNLLHLISLLYYKVVNKKKCFCL